VVTVKHTADPYTDVLDDLAETTAEAQRLLDERDMKVIAAYARGASLRRIAESAGMTHVGVKKLVERRAPDFAMVGPDGEIYAIAEVKTNATGVNPEWSADLLRRFTVVHTFRYDPDTGEAVTE
jgi:hypothetical protein